MSQQLQLTRVRAKLDAVVASFIAHRLATNPTFTSAELHAWAQRHGHSAPGSADRVMRAMRTAGEIAYVLVDKSRGMYRAIALDEVAA